MRKTNVTILLILFSLSFAMAQHTAITTIILMRHAEKISDGTDDPDLKPEGMQRAKRLAALLENTAIDAIYSTHFKRTKNTVGPLAKEKGKDIQVYESLKAEALQKLVAQYSGGTIVIAGHSNTVPAMVNALIGKEEYKTFDDTDYGNLFIITVVGSGKSAKATLLHY
jgi:2,3-bisphosphoglycerate-dependent phosphoglycerate mutase